MRVVREKKKVAKVHLVDHADVFPTARGLVQMDFVDSEGQLVTLMLSPFYARRIRDRILEVLMPHEGQVP